MTNKERHLNRYVRRREGRLQNKLDFNKQYDDYSILTNPTNLVESFIECKKGVSWKYSVQNFHLHLLENIKALQEDLNNNKLTTRGFKNFIINERGKTRYISSPHISERVVQKNLCVNILIPIIRRTLIYDNGASLEGKGTSFARRRLVYHLNDYRRKFGKNGFVLTIDFSKYFNNINHKFLLNFVREEIKDKKVLSICEQAVAEFGDVGLGLGAQISQIFAVFFPNKLDHFIKETLREKYYGRYMDDIYIIHNDKQHLKDILLSIQEFCSKLGITLNEKKTKITSLHQGVHFLQCSYRYGKDGRIIKCGGNSTSKRMRHKLHFFKTMLDNREMNKLDIYNNYRSWRGYMATFDSKQLLRNTDRLYNKLFGGKNGIPLHC